VPADYPDEADDHPDRNDAPPAATNPARPTNPEPDFSARQEAYTSLRLAISAEQTTTAHQATAADRAAYEKWTKDSAASRALWSEIEQHWPPKDRPPANRLKPDEASRVESACDRIADIERDKITPAMREVERQDPDRHLVGFEERLKDVERIKEKAYMGIKNRGRSLEEAVSLVPDTVRFTFQCKENRYTQDVWSDIERLKSQGFEMCQLRNSWTSDQYKGINSQWIEPVTGQRFEVQFHTRISFEAKQLTHKSYERLRTAQPDGPGELEQMVLRTFQRDVAEKVPVPLGATDIPDYP
jgi:hypothetical protein